METRKFQFILTGSLALACTLSLAHGQGSPGATKLLASDAGAADLFGRNLAVDGDRVAVAAPYNDAPLINQGTVYLYEGQTGQELLRLEASDPVAEALFGFGIALEGAYLAVGAPAAQTQSGQQGAVYLYDSSTGAELMKLEVPNAASSPMFGSDVALDGNLLLVGSSRASNSLGVESGTAYLFQLPAGTLLQTIEAPDGEPMDQFGASVALDGAHAVVGAFGDDDFGSGSGSVHAFDTGTGAWQSKFTPLDLSAGDVFGVRLDLDAGRLLVGAPSADPIANLSGAAYLFDVAGGALLHKWTPKDGTIGDSFGSDVSLNGTVAAIGAPLDSVPDFAFVQGSIYLFDTLSGAELAKVTPLALSDSDYFGGSVGLSDTLIAGGATGDDDPVVVSGAVYTVDAGVRLDATPFCTGTGCPCGNDDPSAGCISSRGIGGELFANGTGRVSVDDMFLIARDLPLFSFGMYFMGPSTQAPTALGDGLLCVSGGLLRFAPATSTGPRGNLYMGPGTASLACDLFGPGGCISAGSTWNFQVWFRDTAGPCGTGSGTTNALAVTFTP